MEIKIYSYTDATQLTTHFNIKEFRCKCGKGHETKLSPALVEKLETLFSVLSCSKIIVNSGYRCASHDKAVGGSGSGQHTKGTAADVVCYDQSGGVISAKLVCCKAQDLGFPGIANISEKYQAVHLDVRESGKYYGDEIHGTSTVTSDFYAYFGIQKADSGENSAKSAAKIAKTKGIDVSKHNGTIDWDKVKAAGIQFAMIRLGYGSDLENQDDVQAETNMAECERVGLPYGVYLYSYALSTADAESEIAHVQRVLGTHKPALGIWLDMEDADSYKTKHGKPLSSNGDLYSSICKMFCKATSGGVYASKSVLENVLDVSGLPIWVAQWADTCTYSGDYKIWQYSSTGTVDGISGRVDLDDYCGDLPAASEAESADESDTLEQILAHVASIDEKLQ